MGMFGSILQTLLSPVSSTIAGWYGAGYNATDPRRKIINANQLFPNRATANQLLNSAGPRLRAYARDLERNNATARAGVEALTALIVGTGIQLEPDTGSADLDDRIREEWQEYVKRAMVDGSSLYSGQSLGVAEMVTAGEGLWRLVTDPDIDPRDGIPLRILPLDAEWLDEDAAGSSDLTTVAGIQIDNLGRPVQYLLSNPEKDNEPEIVSEEWVIHFFEKRRPVQQRGETWFAPVIETLMNERDLVDTELRGAKSSASIGLAITSEYHDALDDGTGEDAGSGTDYDPAQNLRLGGVARMYPGEKIESFTNNRPNQQIAPFRQMLRGDIAAALRIPQRFLDRDVSRANYSSMRADMLDTERLLGPIRDWYGHATIGEVYRRVLPLLSARLGIPLPRAKYRLLPAEQPYVDPQKDIGAALEAITGGLSTYEREIGKRGGDWQQVWEQRQAEQQKQEELGIGLTSGLPATETAAEPEPELEPEQPEPQPEEARTVQHIGTQIVQNDSELIGRHIEAITENSRAVVECASASVTREAPTPVINVTAAEQPAPQIDVHVESAVAPVQVSVPTPDVQVQVDSPVQVDNQVVVPQRTIKAKPQADGSVLMEPQP